MGTGRNWAYTTARGHIGSMAPMGAIGGGVQGGSRGGGGAMPTGYL